jgi:hypothetical protein
MSKEFDGVGATSKQVDLQPSMLSSTHTMDLVEL